MNDLSQSPAGRNIYERVGALEQDMNTMKFRIDRFDRMHDDIPTRVNRLEMIAQTQSKALESLDTNVKAMSHQLKFGLGVVVSLTAIIQIFAPHVLRMLIQ